jgi:hypothetical protein
MIAARHGVAVQRLWEGDSVQPESCCSPVRLGIFQISIGGIVYRSLIFFKEIHIILGCDRSVGSVDFNPMTISLWRSVGPGPSVPGRDYCLRFGLLLLVKITGIAVSHEPNNAIITVIISDFCKGSFWINVPVVWTVRNQVTCLITEVACLGMAILGPSILVPAAVAVA